MEELNANKRKRTHFGETDTKLLVECIKKREDVLNNRKTNGITPAMKNKAWQEIIKEYNSSQTGGNKTLIEIQAKYRNMKTLMKKELSLNVKEIKKTGGGSADINISNDFGFSQEQITGLTNQFDSDWEKMRLSSVKFDLVALKEEGIKLDIENKNLINEELKLKIQQMKEVHDIDIENKKLINEQLKLKVAKLKSEVDQIKSAVIFELKSENQ